MVSIRDLVGTAIFLPSSDALRTAHVRQPEHASDCITSVKISYNNNLPLALEFSFLMKIFFDLKLMSCYPLLK